FPSLVPVLVRSGGLPGIGPPVVPWRCVRTAGRSHRLRPQAPVAHVEHAHARDHQVSGTLARGAGPEIAGDDDLLVLTLVVGERWRIVDQCIDSILGLEISRRDRLADHDAAALLADRPGHPGGTHPLSGTDGAGALVAGHPVQVVARRVGFLADAEPGRRHAEVLACRVADLPE